ncbi:MAG: di-trans,poly-cis-decaprenylcistransferase [Candidatus Sungbacteria bacterium]|uniref:Isoprenyl transferase n=2 Tax=Candidatus Sungiibacteriota bacterium TaxID=2750080 RepID=A0A9D6HR61_9BACT|nr:di-trans,poly-cis-decaprenylcistransferase [Candidatus Sungbacteria bacterium]
MSNLPSHIAVIPDGNRRWAKARGLEPWLGHEHGAYAFKEIVKESFAQGIRYFTFWASSEDNIKKRNPLEVAFYFKLIKKAFNDFEKDSYAHDHKIKVDFMGSWEKMFPADIKEIIYRIKKKTENYADRFLTLLLAYDGRTEMLQALHQFYQDNPAVKPTPDFIKKYLYTKDLPSVDLVIRTGGEPHWSAGFMMWDVADSQLYFTPTLWPDFNKKELAKALLSYSTTQRRLGA